MLRAALVPSEAAARARAVARGLRTHTHAGPGEAATPFVRMCPYHCLCSRTAQPPTPHKLLAVDCSGACKALDRLSGRVETPPYRPHSHPTALGPDPRDSTRWTATFEELSWTQETMSGQRSPSNALKLLQVASAVIFCLLTAGVIFGSATCPSVCAVARSLSDACRLRSFAALKNVLVREGVYEGFCDSERDKQAAHETGRACVGQDLQVRYLNLSSDLH